MSQNKKAFILAILMCLASLGAVFARPTVKVSEIGEKIELETLVPQKFGAWAFEPQKTVQVINPQTQELLDKLYSQILTRTYINDAGYRVMLSIAYGGDQREQLQAHRPEVCYPAQGFALKSNVQDVVTTDFGQIPVRRLETSIGARQEPVTYWYAIGGQVVEGGSVKRKLVELTFGMTGKIPDGMLFRVSSIDGDTAKARKMQDEFVNELLKTLSAEHRQRLSGLGLR